MIGQRNFTLWSVFPNDPKRGWIWRGAFLCGSIVEAEDYFDGQDLITYHEEREQHLITF